MTAAQADSAAAKIQAKGRQVTFIKVATTPSDTSAPWRGSDDPRTVPADSEQLFAVFVPVAGSALGLRYTSEELVKRAEQVALVAPGSSFTKDLEDFDEILDSDGSRWRIEFVETLKPADVAVMHSVGVRR